MSVLTREKLNQANDIVRRSSVDAWITFVRETSAGPDPVLPLILQGGLTWMSALIVFRNGRRIAVVGNYDADALRASGDWDEVVPYVQSLREPLLEVLEREIPGDAGILALNFSESDVMADGLTHGMRLVFDRIVAGTRFESGLVSAQAIVGELRGVKSPEERRRIEAAIAEGDAIFEVVADFARAGISEMDVFRKVHRLAAERHLGFSWDANQNPIVNSGPDSMIGHGVPSESIRLTEGHIFHIDLGVTCEDYSSDVQRCWMVTEGDEVPEDVLRALEAVNAAISAGAAAMKPGGRGVDVDAAARRTLVEHGYPEYLHAFGHQVGRVAHDGGAVLGPAWDRYGETPFIPLRQGEIYTLELGITVPGRGYLGLEEMAIVTADGIEWLTDRQWTMPILGRKPATAPGA